MTILSLIRTIGVTRITRAAGLKNTQAVSQWRQIPDRHVLKLEPLFLEQGKDRFDMRPDIFGKRPAGMAKPRKNTTNKPV